MAKTSDRLMPAADVEVDRDRWGRPYIRQPDGTSRKAYSRVTTFIDCLEDKSTLTAWKTRTALVGAYVGQPTILTGVGMTLAEFEEISRASFGDVAPAGAKKTRDARLNDLAEQALDLGGAHLKAEAGTNLHALSEYIDRGADLPGDLFDQDYRDMEAYAALRQRLGWKARAIEQFVVNDEYQTAGTLDRLIELDGELMVADLKTGAVEWSAGKFAMQLALYAHSARYDAVTGKRKKLKGVSLERGILIHLPQGEATATAYSVDLTLGWEAIDLAARVRRWRNAGKRAIDFKRAL